MIIEGLVPDPRRPGSIRVVVGGRPAWTVPSEIVAELALAAHQPVRGEVVARLDLAADEEGAFRAGLRALERRSHAARELGSKLGRKGHTERAVNAALARLTRLGLLDDGAFATQYVRAQSERGRGPIRLRRDLRQRGIAPDVIEEALGALEPDAPEDPLARPRALAERRLRLLQDLPRDTRRRRLVAFLGRRGFPGGDVRTIVEALVP